MEHVGSEAARLDRVETEVSSIRTEQLQLRDEVGGLKATVQSFGAVLTRIEDGIVRAQERDDHAKERSRPNITAVISVLVTIILALVGGSWVTAGQIARQDERALAQVREMDQLHEWVARMDNRQWQRGRGNAVP